MKNPWKDIALSDYENHMRLGSVMQLQVLNQLMKGQFGAYPVSSAIVLGVAGGNGLEHVENSGLKKVYGVDVNPAYLAEASRRHAYLGDRLECLCIDLLSEAEKLPNAGLLIANLLIEYIGYECFQSAVRQADPAFVSCVIQINLGDGWVSDSPYLHVFDGLEAVHHQMEEQALAQAMSAIGYLPIKTLGHPLPGGKKLVQMDFEKQPL